MLMNYSWFKLAAYTAGVLLLGVVDGMYFSAALNEAKVAAVRKITDAQWKLELVKREFAQYNMKTGEWEFRSLEDVSSSAFIQGKGIALEDAQFVNYSLDKRRSRK
jgi:hypothetical protein